MLFPQPADYRCPIGLALVGLVLITLGFNLTQTHDFTTDSPYDAARRSAEAVRAEVRRRLW